MKITNMISRLLAVFGLLLIFSVSGWGAKTTDLSITKTVNNAAPTMNDTVTFTIIGKNNGPTTTGMTITDILPDGFSNISASENGGYSYACTVSGQTVTCNGNKTFATSDTVKVTITAKIISTATLTNTATVASSSSVADSNSANNTASVSVTASPFTPKISISNASNTEGNTGYKAIIFNVTLDAPSDQEITVNYSTRAGTATSDVDYVSISNQTLHLAAGTTSQVISISAIGDLIPEGNENFYVDLSNPVNATILNTTGTGIIIDDDGGTVVGTGNRPFTLRNPVSTQIIKGDKIVIGNSIECVTDSKSSYGNCTDDLTKNDNSYYVKYLNVDNNTSIFNSSQASLTVPSNTHVVWAGLYWQGNIHGTNDLTGGRHSYTNHSRLGVTKTTYASAFTTVDLTNLNSNHNANKVYLKAPNASSYTLVTAAQLDVDHYYGSSWGDVYNAFADVTSLVSQSGTYTVANLQTMEGLESHLGNYGAWSLVVIYQADNSASTKLKAKNVSIFDGYQAISDQNTANIPIVGFKTPLNSNQIVASLSTFLGEGEQAYTGDNIYFDGKDIPGATVNNIADAQISGNFTRTPSWTNTNGIDIDTFDISSLLSTGQSSATVQLTSSKDGYWASMIAFSADLYIPNICYAQTFTNLNGDAITQLDVGTPFLVNTTINNKSTTTQPAEDAQDVVVQVAWDKNLAYTTGKGNTSYQDVGSLNFITMTDTAPTHNDNIDYSTDTNTTTIYVGTNSNFNNGGNLAVNNTANMKTTITVATIPTDNIIDNIYRAAFYSPTAGNVPLSIIDPCGTVNKTLNVQATGSFQLVEVGGGCGSYMHTKIVGQSFSADIVSCDVSNNLVNSSSATDVNITYSDFNKNPIVLSPAIATAHFPISTKRLTVQIPAYLSAIASINLSSKKSSEDTWSSISNNFAVRPNSFAIDTNTTSKTQAGKSFNLRFYAKDISSNNVGNYNEEVGSSFDVNVSEEKTAPCITGNFLPSIKNSWSFSNGYKAISTNYSEVGKIDITITEDTKSCAERFAAVDCTDVESAGWTKDNNLSIKSTSTTLNFIPDHFTVSYLVQNNGNGFTYVSSDPAMSAEIRPTIVAKNVLEGITSNYQASCYAKDTNYTITFDTPLILPSNGLTQVDFNETLTAQSGSSSLSATSFSLNNLSATQLFTSATPGTANPIITFNFDRSKTIAVSPFLFNITDVRVSDADNVIGDNSQDKNATFVYGRTHSPRYRFTGNSGDAKIYYETYCGTDGNKTMLPTGSIGSSDSVGWYLNPLHDTATNGNITTVSEKGASTIATSTLTSISNGSVSTTLAYGGTKFPYKTTMQITPSSWLIYDKYNSSATTNDFEVEFYGGSTTWTGTINTPSGTTQTTTDSDATPVTNKRILW